MRLNFFKKIFIVLIIISFFSISIAQNSFYSKYGLGTNYQNASTRMEGLGYSGSAIYDSLHVTSQNPALWHSFNTVSLQGKLNYSRMTTSKINNNYQTAALAGFTVKMPLGKYSGLAFGLQPSYRVNSESEMSSSQLLSGDSLGYNNHAIIEGGISEVFIGGGYRLTKYLSTGIVLKFLFGKYSSNLKTDLNTRPYYYARERNIKGEQLGLGLFWNVPRNYSISFYHDRNLDFQYNNKVTYYNGTGDTTDYSSIDYLSNYRLGARKYLTSDLVFSADLALSELPQSLMAFNSGLDGSYDNSYLIGFGLEKQPSTEYNPGFFQRMFYRLGGYYKKDGFKPKNNNFTSDQYNEIGISAGLGIPFYNDFSRIDLSMIYSVADGYINPSIGKEKKITINIEITSGGFWFYNALKE